MATLRLPSHLIWWVFSKQTFSEQCTGPSCATFFLSCSIVLLNPPPFLCFGMWLFQLRKKVVSFYGFKQAVGSKNLLNQISYLLWMKLALGLHLFDGKMFHSKMMIHAHTIFSLGCSYLLSLLEPSSCFVLNQSNKLMEWDLQLTSFQGSILPFWTCSVCDTAWF